MVTYAKASLMKPDKSFGVDGRQAARLAVNPEKRNGTWLNLGCGFTRFDDAINVDGYAICKPDVCHDLNKAPYPWGDNSIDYILAAHVFEHLEDWWTAFTECARILKPTSWLEIRTPDESSSTALGFRDHLHIFHLQSFHGIGRKDKGTLYRSGTNAWAAENEGKVPLELIHYRRVPFTKYNWMKRFPPLLAFCANHMRNFIWEQQFIFEKF